MSGMNKGRTSRRYKEFLYINKNKISALIENINRQLKKKKKRESKKLTSACRDA